jgi:hypothetical protein
MKSFLKSFLETLRRGVNIIRNELEYQAQSQVQQELEAIAVTHDGQLRRVHLHRRRSAGSS